MKNFLCIFVLLLIGFFHFPIKAQIQWDIQTAQGLTVFSDPIMIFSAVDHNICWGIENFELGHGITNPKFALTTDGGSNWSVDSAQIPSGSGVEAIYARDTQTAWIAVYNTINSANSGIYKTSNGGLSWLKQGNAFTGGGHPTIIYFYNKSDTGICVGSPRNNHFEIYTTKDGGVNWDTVTNIPSSGGDFFTTGSSGSGNIFLFSTALRKIYRSTDRGITWTKIDYNLSSGTGVDIQLKDSLQGLACTYFGDHINRVATTANGGVNWSLIQPNPPAQPSFYFLTYVPGTGGMYMVTSHNNYSWNDEVTTPGSMFTKDGGNTWIPIDSKPHGPSSFSDDGWGWSSGIGDTIYRIFRDDLLVTGVKGDANINPTHFYLDQNYPNPFNPTTKINYSIPSSEFVTLKVYDVLGNEVATLVDEYKSAGKYEITFNATGLTSSIYIYQLIVGNYIQTRKMVLLK
jgi:Secretion system C-terminal sorting domain